MKKILLIGSQHGNELLGERLYSYISEQRPELLREVDFMIGNPKARKRRVRFIESDLNRSFNGKQGTYEEKRAQEICEYINKNGYDLVLDLHTTTCKQPPCIISATIHHPYIYTSSIQHVVHMGHDIVHTSLIGVCPVAISIEVNRDKSSDQKTLATLCDDIVRFLLSRPSDVVKKLYRVDGLIEKTEVSTDEAAGLRNFHKTSRGFYPVLVGEEAYKQTHYLGFRAKDMTLLRYSTGEEAMYNE